MLWNLLVFAIVGLLVGAGSRLFYQERQFGNVLAALVLGGLGAVGGGAISWMQWPFEAYYFHAGNLILAVIGAALFILVPACRSFAERLLVQRSQSPSQ